LPDDGEESVPSEIDSELVDLDELEALASFDSAKDETDDASRKSSDPRASRTDDAKAKPDDRSSEPLRIDSLSDRPSKDLISVRCEICDTRVLIPRDTKNEIEKCPECYSRIDVKRAIARQLERKGGNEDPKEYRVQDEPFDINKLPDPMKSAFGVDTEPRWRSDDRIFAEEVDSSGEALAPIPIETRPDYSRVQENPEDPIELTDDSGELQLLPADVEVKRTLRQSVGFDDDPFAKQPDSNDPLTRRATDKGPSEVELQDDEESSPDQTIGNSDLGANPYRARVTESLHPDDAEKLRNPYGMRLKQLGTFSPGEWRWFRSLATNVGLGSRLLVVAVVLAVAYVLFDVSTNLWNATEASTSGRVISAIVGSLAVAIMAAGWMLATMIGLTLFQEAERLQPLPSSWTDIAWRDALGRVQTQGLVLWVSAIPAIFLSILLLIVGMNVAWIGLLLAVSVMMIAPTFLATSQTRESPLAFMPRPFATYLARYPMDWIRFATGSVLSCVLFAIGSALLNMPIFLGGLAGAFVHVVAWSLFWSVSGLYSGLLNENMRERARREEERRKAFEANNTRPTKKKRPS
jgi:hypothetical protein